jgi:hypothetical protein
MSKISLTVSLPSSCGVGVNLRLDSSGADSIISPWAERRSKSYSGPSLLKIVFVANEPRSTCFLANRADTARATLISIGYLRPFPDQAGSILRLFCVSINPPSGWNLVLRPSHRFTVLSFRAKARNLGKLAGCRISPFGRDDKRTARHSLDVSNRLACSYLASLSLQKESF